MPAYHEIPHTRTSRTLRASSVDIDRVRDWMRANGMYPMHNGDWRRDDGASGVIGYWRDAWHGAIALPDVEGNPA